MPLPVQIPNGVPEAGSAAPVAWLAAQAPSPLDLLVWAAVVVLVAVAVVHAVLGLVVKWRGVFPRPPDGPNTAARGGTERGRSQVLRSKKSQGS